MSDLTYKTICNKCGKKTWYEEERPCTMSYLKHCGECGASLDKSYHCPGTLKKIDYSDINQEFVPYLHKDIRVRVVFPGGEVKTGLVGMTTGWKPVLILLANRRSHGSSDLLTKDVRQSIAKVTRREQNEH